jgi:hypothetical protein
MIMFNTIRQDHNSEIGEFIWVPTRKPLHFIPGNQPRIQVVVSVQHD